MVRKGYSGGLVGKCWWVEGAIVMVSVVMVDGYIGCGMILGDGG